MARAPWQPREGETEEERETRLAADAVHRRLEQARQRELEEAYWRSRATSSAPDADSFERNIVAARSATPRATLAGVSDAAPSTRGDGSGGLMSDLEVQELARGTRVGATPDVSRRVAEEVLAAERVAVGAACARRPRTARGPPRAGARRVRFPAHRPPRPRAARSGPRRAAAASRRDAEESAEVPRRRRRRAPRGRRRRRASAGMTSALWQMARTPGLAKLRTTTRTTTRYLVSEAPSFAPRIPNVNESEENERVSGGFARARFVRRRRPDSAAAPRCFLAGGRCGGGGRAQKAGRQGERDPEVTRDGLVLRENRSGKTQPLRARRRRPFARRFFSRRRKNKPPRVSPRSRRDSHHTSPPAWPVRDPTNVCLPRLAHVVGRRTPDGGVALGGRLPARGGRRRRRKTTTTTRAAPCGSRTTCAPCAPRTVARRAGRHGAPGGGRARRTPRGGGGGGASTGRARGAAAATARAVTRRRRAGGAVRRGGGERATDAGRRGWPERGPGRGDVRGARGGVERAVAERRRWETTALIRVRNARGEENEENDGRFYSFSLG